MQLAGLLQEVEARLKQEVTPLGADLSLPANIEERIKAAATGGGYGQAKETSQYTQVCTCLLHSAVCCCYWPILSSQLINFCLTAGGHRAPADAAAGGGDLGAA